jgi:PEP-CTERM motif
VSINLQFQSTALPDFNNTAGIITGGTEDPSGNLNFTGLSMFLVPGTYWITAWVVRPELPTGGQWFWDTTNPGAPIGSEFYIQNPGGGLIPGASSAVPGSTVLGTPPSDLAFTLFGQAVVPEPSSVVLLAIGGLGLSIFARRSRLKAQEGRAKDGVNSPGHNA